MEQTPYSKGNNADLTDYVDSFLAESNLDYPTGDVVSTINEKGSDSVDYFISKYETILTLIKEKMQISNNQTRLDNIRRMNENSLVKLQNSREELQKEINATTNLQEKISIKGNLDDIDKQIKSCLELINDNRITMSDIVEQLSKNKQQQQSIMYELETFVKELFGHSHSIDTHLLNEAKAEIANELFNHKIDDYPDEEWIDPRASGKQQFISTIENKALKPNGKFNHVAYRELLEVYQNWKSGEDKYMKEVIDYLFSYDVVTQNERTNMLEAIKQEVEVSDFKKKFRGFR